MPATKPKLIRRITEEFIEDAPEEIDDLDDVESEEDQDSDGEDDSDKPTTQRRKR